MIHSAVRYEEIDGAVDEHYNHHQVQNSDDETDIYCAREFIYKRKQKNIEQQKRKVMQCENTVVKVPPFLFVMKYPQKQGENRKIDEERFWEIVKRGFEQFS